MNRIESICQNFSRHAGSYEGAAKIQALAAKKLAQLFLKDLPPGPLLEIGCGTGLLSQEIAQQYTEREIHFTDLSPAMVAATQKRLGERPNYRFYCLNGEELQEKARYAAIFSSFTLQWFLDLKQGLENLSAALKPEGALFLAAQGSESYPEWKEACKALNIPYGGNPLASGREFANISSMQSIHLEEEFQLNQYPKALDFFHHFKELGANTALAAPKLPFLEFKLLLKKLDQAYPVAITTEIIYYIGKK